MRTGRQLPTGLLSGLVCGLLAGAGLFHGLANAAPTGVLNGAPSGTALLPTPQLVLDAEPPALRNLLAQGNALEELDNPVQGAWQAALRYCQAASLGSIEGQYRLGMLYAFGQGVAEDRALAAALFSLAGSRGHTQAARMLEIIEFTSSELPGCMTHTALPKKAPLPLATAAEPDTGTIRTAEFNGLRIELGAADGAGIDKLVSQLPQHKRWIVPLATKLSAWHELDPKLVLAVIAAESNFESNARSPKQAQGLMQLIPDTAARFNVKNAFDATQNLRGGMRYLRWLLAYYRGNLPYALAAYNAGEGRVDQYHGVPPFNETRHYVQRILGLYGKAQHTFDERLVQAPGWLATSMR